MKILIIQTGFLGDIILSTPVITALKSLYPNATLSFMTTPGGTFLLNGDPDLDEIIVFDKRRNKKGLKGLLNTAKKLKNKKFARVYCLHKSYRTAALIFLASIPFKAGFKKAKCSFVLHERASWKQDEHDAIRNLSILDFELDIKTVNSDLRLYLPNNYPLNDEIKQILYKKYILLSPGSAWKTKQWNMEGYRQTAKYFIEQGYIVAVSGSPEEKNVCDYICQETSALNLSGKLNLTDLKFLMKNAELLICNDSMALHMASAFKTPCVAVFCSTIPEFGYGPWHNRNIIIEKKIPCRPCGRHGHKSCPNDTELCMNIDSSLVIKAAEQLLQGNEN